METNKTISWEEFSKSNPEIYMWNPRELTNISCPKCSAKIYRRNDIVLTSYPCQYQYECDACGWVGYAFV